MNTILSEGRNEYIIKKSRFIGFIFHIYNEEDVPALIAKLHSEFKDATHITYAYRTTDGKYRMSDANEPKNSAGKPIFNIIEKNELYNVLICVIRYFGGIKLGLGGLVRAYSHTASDLVRAGVIMPLVKVCRVQLKVDYSNTSRFEHFMSSCAYMRLENTQYTDIVEYTCIVSENALESLKNAGIIKQLDIKEMFYSSF